MRSVDCLHFAQNTILYTKHILCRKVAFETEKVAYVGISGPAFRNVQHLSSSLHAAPIPNGCVMFTFYHIVQHRPGKTMQTCFSWGRLVVRKLYTLLLQELTERERERKRRRSKLVGSFLQTKNETENTLDRSNYYRIHLQKMLFPFSHDPVVAPSLFVSSLDFTPGGYAATIVCAVVMAWLFANGRGEKCSRVFIALITFNYAHRRHHNSVPRGQWAL